MKNVLLILVSLLLLSFLSSCTAEELPATEHTVQTNTIGDLPPKDQEPPKINLPPVKNP